MRVINPLAMIGIALATGVVAAILSPLAVEPFDTRPADVILKEAYATAKSENKRVFVILTATWCQPCRVFWDRINQDPWRTML